MRARISQAAGAVWTPQKAAAAAGEGEGGSDDHITLVLDESVGQNYELLRRNESPDRVGSIGSSGSGSDSQPLLHVGRGGALPSSSSSSVGGHKYLAPVPPHGGGVSASPSSSSLSSKLHAHAHPDADEADPEARVYHGHRASFRVIGVQISHLSRTGQFVFCTFGVFFFLLIYGFLQEYMVIHVFERKLGLFLTLCQFCGYALLSSAHRAIHADTPRRIPLGYYLLLAALQASMQGLTNLSMRWLNYPAKMLFKSSRVIPTMAVGILYMRKRYKPRDYLVVALLSLGLVCFMRADVKVSPAFHPLGIFFICLALAVDAAIVNLQEFTLRKYDASHDELIFYSYGLGSGFLLLYCLPSRELWDGIAFLREAGPHATACLALFCACGYFGVTCVAALTKKFGALVSTMTTTARKALTLFLSFFLFPKPATAMHVVGGLLFVLGLTMKAVPGPGNGGRSSSSSSSSSSNRRRHRDGGVGAGASSICSSSNSKSRAALKASQYRALLSAGPAASKGGGGMGMGMGGSVSVAIPPV